ncbi:hypothetical protein [Equine parapoxvirus]|nr:hypothetical protein [Equine parapoxvirus]
MDSLAILGLSLGVLCLVVALLYLLLEALLACERAQKRRRVRANARQLSEQLGTISSGCSSNAIRVGSVGDIGAHNRWDSDSETDSTTDGGSASSLPRYPGVYENYLASGGNYHSRDTLCLQQQQAPPQQEAPLEEVRVEGADGERPLPSPGAASNGSGSSAGEEPDGEFFYDE